ncbi:MAG: hypothetical protein ACOX3W_09150 [Christensenellaceae bacterium]|jgi:mannitol-1-phosphate 5-dehydrogenase
MANYQKEAVLIGAGKIGRGYMAYIFNNAGYRMTFLEYDETLVTQMRTQGYYTIFMRDRHNETADWDVFRIENYDAFCTETEWDACVDVLSTANYATVQVFPGAIKSIGHMIGEAAKKRMLAGNEETLDIFFVINFLDADVLFREAALEIMQTEEERIYLDKYIGFVYGLVRGSGPMPNQEMLEIDPIAISCADQNYLPVDVDQMKGPMPEDVNFIPTHNVGALVKRKVWGGNVSHCCLAYYGKQRGYTYGYEASLDPYIHKCGEFATQEALKGLELDITFDPADIKRYFIDDDYGKEGPYDPSKIDTEVKDPLNRIGADPIRKLARNDRFIGPALLCLKHGVVPYFLARGAAMGFFFENEEDPAAVEIQNYIAAEGIEKAIEKYCQLDKQDALENTLYQMVLSHYYDIKEVDPYYVTL